MSLETSSKPAVGFSNVSKFTSDFILLEKFSMHKPLNLFFISLCFYWYFYPQTFRSIHWGLKLWLKCMGYRYVQFQNSLIFFLDLLFMPQVCSSTRANYEIFHILSKMLLPQKLLPVLAFSHVTIQVTNK